MPKTPTKTARRRHTKRTHRRSVASTDRAAGAPKRSNDLGSSAHRLVVENGRPTHVIVPLAEYERLIQAEMVEGAVTKLADDAAEWVDAEVVGLKLAGRRIAEARKAKGMTQKQLGEKLNIPQSQVSRTERNPDHATLRTLKRIARALGVDVGALV
jgi:UDP-N-acetylglucosamine 1-carboxyvinyltransferase